jgi:hypothetical protein
VRREQRALAAETLVFYQFHRFLYLIGHKDTKKMFKVKKKTDIFFIITTTLTTKTTLSR